jgi:putative methyltransferase (TIGR04325 family)
LSFRHFFYPILRVIRKLRFFLSNSSRDGYDQELLAREVVRRDAQDFAEGRFAHCRLDEFFQRPLLKAGINVLDFGGGGARHGFRFLESQALRWAVVETPAMARAGEDLLDANSVTFHQSIAAAESELRRVDVVHVSSALQYTPDPEAFLRDLISLAPQAMIFEKLVLTKRRKSVSLLQYSMLRDNLPSNQGHSSLSNIPIRYPLTAISTLIFEDIIGQEYAIIQAWKDGPQSHLPALLGLQQVGFLLMRKSSSTKEDNS